MAGVTYGIQFLNGGQEMITLDIPHIYEELLEEMGDPTPKPVTCGYEGILKLAENRRGK